MRFGILVSTGTNASDDELDSSSSFSKLTPVGTRPSSHRGKHKRRTLQVVHCESGMEYASDLLDILTEPEFWRP